MAVRPPVPPGTRTIERLAGVGGILFAATVLVQNIVRASAPSFTADPATVTAYFADHRAAGIVPLALFPVGMVGLFLFATGVWLRTGDPRARWWAGVGTLAVATVGTLFALVNVVEIAVVTRADDLAGSPEVVRALWAVHSAAFGLNLAAVALALLGLSRAARAGGLIPRPLDVAALAGAACLFLAALFTVAIVDGGGWLYVGLIGFVVWGLFLVVAGIALATGWTAATVTAAGGSGPPSAVTVTAPARTADL